LRVTLKRRLRASFGGLIGPCSKVKCDSNIIFLIHSTKAQYPILLARAHGSKRGEQARHIGH
jgi:hypothetical protein